MRCAPKSIKVGARKKVGEVTRDPQDPQAEGCVWLQAAVRKLIRSHPLLSQAAARDVCLVFSCQEWPADYLGFACISLLSLHPPWYCLSCVVCLFYIFVCKLWLLVCIIFWGRVCAADAMPRYQHAGTHFADLGRMAG